VLGVQPSLDLIERPSTYWRKVKKVVGVDGTANRDAFLINKGDRTGVADRILQQGSGPSAA
jgi:hypothetical protein